MLNHPLSAGLEASAAGMTSTTTSAPGSSHPQHQFPSSYDYQQHQQHHQQVSGDSLRPTLDPGYYSSQVHHAYASAAPHAYYAVPHHSSQPHPQPHPHQYAPSSSMSLKRKMPGPHQTSSSSASTSPSGSYSAQDKLCDLCYHPDPVLFSSACGHLFHSRCVHVWPLAKCPMCDADLSAAGGVGVIKLDMNAQIDTRSGKWTRAEEKFIDVILAEFDRSAFPLANGTPVRLVLAKLLNCSTMRLSKKFQKNALGKRTFRVAKPTAKGELAMEFNRSDHMVRQKEFSRLEAIFRHELIEQFRRENNTDDGAYVETQDLRHAVKQFWVVNFLKLAVLLGQQVQGLDISDSKKKKQALLMLRNGQYDELLSWNGSPVNTPTITPMPHMTGAGEAGGTPWNTGGYSTELELGHQQPAKKMRTPESMPQRVTPANCEVGDGSHFEIQPAPPMAAAAYEYASSKTSPHGYSPAAADQHHQHQPQYNQYGSGYSSRPAYGQYQSGVKPEKVESVHHQPQQQPHHYGHMGSAGGLPGGYSSAYRGAMGQQHQQYHAGSYQGSSENAGQPRHHPHPQQPHHHHAGGPQYPWDELLEGIGPEPAQQVVDPALQAWSNMHIM